MAIPIIPILAAVGGLAYLVLRRKEGDAPGVGVMGLPGSGSNVPRPADDPTRVNVTMPDGSIISTHPAVSIAIYQAISSGDPTYIRNTAKQLQSLGWDTEAAKLETVAQQIESGKASSVAIPGVAPLPSTPVVAPDLPPSVVAVMTTIIARQNPAEMRAYAAKLREKGYAEPAASLEAAATQVEVAQQAAAAKQAAVAAVPTVAMQTPPALPQLTVPTPTSPPNIATVPMPPSTPVPVMATPTQVIMPETARRKAADILVKHLVVDNPPKRGENKTIVKNYQAAASRSIDGLYGPGDAKSLATAESGKHVPPPPRYWPKRSYAQAVQEYEAWLIEQRSADPARAGEWSAALAQARRYYPS